MSHLPWGATLVVVTSNDRPGLWDTLLALRRAGFNVVVVFCDYPSLIGYNQARGRADEPRVHLPPGLEDGGPRCLATTLAVGR